MLHGFLFQQDGARPHRTQENLTRISEVFGERIIGLDAEKHTGSGIDWPPYSPDVTVCDFFLWDYTKDKMYETPTQNLEQLQERITEVIQSLPEDIIQRAVTNFQTRFQQLVAIEVRHFENMIH